MASRHRAGRRWPGWFALALCAVALGVTAYFAWPDTVEPAAPVTHPVPVASSVPTPTAEPNVDQRAVAITDGTVQIGDEGARPGLWQSLGGPACKWSRDKGVSWTLDARGAAREPIVISLRKATWFVTSGCGTWTWVKP